ncbi:MAG: phosphate signaling complex protein PhoU [Spirochaetales bacterium]|nr:phosphate signaling complex protein PhoU [Spirochaetales bacterium]
MLKDKIVELRETLIAQANTVEKMLAQCRRGLTEADREALMETIETCEPAVNRLEIQIDELCIAILALFHPEAKDLRVVMMMSKMTSDLERMGDCAVNVAESGLFLMDRPPVGFRDELTAMAEGAAGMLRDSMRAFIEENADLARDVCRRDASVDALRNKIWKELSCLGETDQPTIETALHILRVANNFEKIADVTTNIAEETVFIAAGSVIKHHRDERP